mmetsp:Transcript_5529/g.19237  ORF Transcript_5529/g.19237 Transcript_5529/m.19237 type:complete len:315 (+) Transcript_5529:235-1179(+)
MHRGDAIWVVVGAVEGEGTVEHGEEQDPARPHVGPLGVVTLLCRPRREHLWGHVARGAYGGEGVLLGAALGEPEVRDLYGGGPPVVQEGVVQLQVPVSKAVVVAELHRGDELLEEVVGLALRQEEPPAAPAALALAAPAPSSRLALPRPLPPRLVVPLADVSREGPAGRVLEHDRQEPRREDHPLQVDDVDVLPAELGLDADLLGEEGEEDLGHRPLDQLHRAELVRLELAHEPGAPLAAAAQDVEYDVSLLEPELPGVRQSPPRFFGPRPRLVAVRPPRRALLQLHRPLVGVPEGVGRLFVIEGVAREVRLRG